MSVRRGRGRWLALAALATGLASMVVVASAQADVRFAEPGGDGNETECFQSDPCDIQVAVEDPSVTDGDEIVVLPGIYALGGDPLLVGKAIDLHGAAGAPRPTIMTTSLLSVTVDFVAGGAGGALVRDLRIQNQTAGGGAGIIISNASIGERLVVESTTENSGTACQLGGGALLRDSICSAPSAPGELGIGVSVLTFAAEVEQASLLNVTAFGNTGILARGDAGGTATLNAKNVIAEGPFADALARADQMNDKATIVLEHSNYDSDLEFGGLGSESVTDPGTGTNQTAPPLLVNPAGGDFHQLLGSPTIGAGATDPELGALDIDGDPRIHGGAPDIGADEFVPAVPPAATPSNAFSFGKLKRNKKKGIAFLIVVVPGPGEVGLKGKGVATIASARSARLVAGPGPVKLKVKPGKKGKRARKIRRALETKGKAKVKVSVTYVPTGGTAKTVARKLKLVKR